MLLEIVFLGGSQTFVGVLAALFILCIYSCDDSESDINSESGDTNFFRRALSYLTKNLCEKGNRCILKIIKIACGKIEINYRTNKKIKKIKKIEFLKIRSLILIYSLNQSICFLDFIKSSLINTKKLFFKIVRLFRRHRAAKIIQCETIDA